MSYKLIVKPEAAEEIRLTKDWYDAGQSDLGADFVRSLDEVFDRIIKNPNLYAIRYKKVRMGLTRRFPYAVHYLIESKRVIVLAVLHTRRKPRG